MARTTRLASSAVAAAAADGQRFSSVISLSNGKIPSLLPPPPKLPFSEFITRIITALFPTPTPAEITYSYPENSPDESRVGVSMPRLQKFSQTDCKYSELCADEDLPSINRMESRSSLHSFNLFPSRLANNERYSDVFWHFRKMNSLRLVPDFYTLNILLECFCNANQVRDGFMVMGKIVTSGYSPNFVTFTSLIKGLFIGSRVADAFQLFLKLKKFGFRPDVFACNTIIHELCRSGNTSNAITLLEEMVNANCQYGIGCKPNVISHSLIVNGLCKEGKEDKAVELLVKIHAVKLLEEINAAGLYPKDFLLQNSLCILLWCSRKLTVVRNFFNGILDRGTRLDAKTWIRGVCRSGNMTKAIRLLEDMVGEYAENSYRSSFSEIFDYLYDEWMVEEAMELSFLLIVMELYPDIFVYISLMNGLCCGGKSKEARILFDEMLVRATRLDKEAFYSLLELLEETLLEIDGTSLHAAGSQGTV